MTSEDEGPSEAAGHINEKSNDSDVESVAESLDWDWLSAPLDTTPKKSKNALCDKMAGAIEEIDANMNDDIQIVAHPKANKPFPSNSGEDHFPEFGEAEASSSILPQNNIPPWHHSASQEVPQITENRTPTRNDGFIPPNNRKRYFDHGS